MDWLRDDKKRTKRQYLYVIIVGDRKSTFNRNNSLRKVKFNFPENKCYKWFVASLLLSWTAVFRHTHVSTLRLWDQGGNFSQLNRNILTGAGCTLD